MELDFVLSVEDDRRSAGEARLNMLRLETSAAAATANLEYDYGDAAEAAAEAAAAAEDAYPVPDATASPVELSPADALAAQAAQQPSEPANDGVVKNEARIVECGGTVRVIGAPNDRAHLNGHFSINSTYEFEQVMRCLGLSDDAIPKLAFAKEDGTFSTTYRFAGRAPYTPFDVFGDRVQDLRLRLKMPAKITNVSNNSHKIFADFKISHADDTTVEIMEDYGPPIRKCLDALRENKASFAVQYLCKSAQSTFEEMDASLGEGESPYLDFEIVAEKSKFDLPIWVAILGALLGSGIIVNLISIATRKRATT